MESIDREDAACLPNPVRSQRSSWNWQEGAFEKIAPFMEIHTLIESFFSRNLEVENKNVSGICGWQIHNKAGKGEPGMFGVNSNLLMSWPVTTRPFTETSL